MMFQLLIGVVLAALIFSALLWSIYRAVVTAGYPRINAIIVSLATLMGMMGASWSITPLVMIAAPACMLFGLAQIWTDPGWAKLLPLVQFLLGFALLNVLLATGP